MGWLWSSSSQPPPQEEQPTAPSLEAPAAPTAQQASTPNDPADTQLEEFLQLIHTAGDESSKPPSSSSSSPPTTTPSEDTKPSVLSWLSQKAKTAANNKPDEAPILDPLSESLFPTEMGCAQTFELAWSCSSLGGQFMSMYRHGNMRECSENWDDFWFCMRTRAYSGPVKADLIKQHYRNKAYRKYGGDKPSSEDVWERRTEKVPLGSAFSTPLPVTEEEVNAARERMREEERKASIRDAENI
ncbi:hypothetical protein E4U22_006712 [Claviceps purpurea]|nr:hypothetical protein E4U25_005251 [Claviceps purpurea]KAG6293926.1 hypothetical protein E4U46_006940 [Claviceps purpurea]KAG6324924.1 hypothetical protein E4U22_006712 [Claviceps purpurea]